jgi:hypothetical protein
MKLSQFKQNNGFILLSNGPNVDDSCGILNRLPISTPVRLPETAASSHKK